MKHLPYLFIVGLLLFNCNEPQRRDCTQFKTGTFTFSYFIDNKEKLGTFTRTEEYNIDYYDDKIDSSTIRWINDCEFVLKKINPKNMAEEQPVHMKILKTTDSSYTFEYQLVVKNPNKKKRVEKGTAYIQ